MREWWGKQYGFLIPAENEGCDVVEIYEAPIDAMSGATLRQYKHDIPWRGVHYLAMGELNHQPIEYFLSQHPQVKTVVLCFDHDEPGRNFTETVAKKLTNKKYTVRDMPEFCNTRLRSTGEPIAIKYGVPGYIPLKGLTGSKTEIDKRIAELNQYHGADKAQIAAMEAGSLFG